MFINLSCDVWFRFKIFYLHRKDRNSEKNVNKFIWLKLNSYIVRLVLIINLNHIIAYSEYFFTVC